MKLSFFGKASTHRIDMKYLLIAVLCCSCVTTGDLDGLIARIDAGGDARTELVRTIETVEARTDKAVAMAASGAKGILGLGAAGDATGISALLIAALNHMRNRKYKQPNATPEA